MHVIVRIIVLSVVAGAYMVWAFRGVETDPRQSVEPLVIFVAGFLAPTLLIAAVYILTLGKAKDSTSRASFIFRCWMVTAALVAAGWLVYFYGDTAAGGFFRANLIGGVIGLIVVVVAGNLLVSAADRYLEGGRR